MVRNPESAPVPEREISAEEYLMTGRYDEIQEEYSADEISDEIRRLAERYPGVAIRAADALGDAYSAHAKVAAGIIKHSETEYSLIEIGLAQKYS